MLAKRAALWLIAGLTLVIAPLTIHGFVSPVVTGADAVAPIAVTRDARPNILFITTDDQRVSDLRWMPKTRALIGAQGVTFTQALSPHPLCCPARAEMITGQYAQNNGVRNNNPAAPYGGLDALIDPANTLGSWLQNAGYRTSLFGKYLNGYTAKHGAQAGWDAWNAFADIGNGYTSFQTFNPDTDPPHGVWHKPTTDGAYSTDWVRDRVNEEITAAASTQINVVPQPFFIWASYYAPHGSNAKERPPIPAARHRGTLKSSRNPSASLPSFNEVDLSDKPPYVRAQARRLDTSFGRMQNFFRLRVESLRAVDEAVASHLTLLGQQGLLSNTYVVFTSDNGYLLGEHSYQGKIVGYEESLLVPTMVRGPGIAAGRRDNRVINTTDWAPTFVDLAGATAGRVADGVSLVPVLRGQAGALTPDTFLIQAGAVSASSSAGWLFRGVRTSRYTYMAYNDGFFELYDRAQDPWQLRSVANDPAYAQVRKELQFRLTALADCSGSSCQRIFGPVAAPVTPKPSVKP